MIPTRVFLVGCPRSGTTLLQSILASHPSILSFPESHFFSCLLPNKISKFFNKPSTLGAKRLKEFLEEIGSTKEVSDITFQNYSTKNYVDFFVSLLDEVALNSKKSVWIEKTPRHLQYLNQVDRFISNVKVIHILRNGKDVVASMYEATHNYPDKWGGCARSIDECIVRWKKDIKRSLRCSSKPNHYLIRYEDLVASPEQVVEKICHFVEIDYCYEMLNAFSERSSKLILVSEDWKDVGASIVNKGHAKYHKIFSSVEKAYIDKKLQRFLKEYSF